MYAISAACAWSIFTTIYWLKLQLLVKETMDTDVISTTPQPSALGVRAFSVVGFTHLDSEEITIV